MLSSQPVLLPHSRLYTRPFANSHHTHPTPKLLFSIPFIYTLSSYGIHGGRVASIKRYGLI